MSENEHPSAAEIAQDYALHHATPSWQRRLLYLAGLICLLLGAIGAVLPGLPTTPFVLLAAACFLRASPRMHRWLLSSRSFGPLLREWELHRSIPRRVKRYAISAMLISGAVSIWVFAGRPVLQTVIAAGLLFGAVMVLRQKSRD
jgi:uncharacterized membrane protein YbaN (DUF454 family)